MWRTKEYIEGYRITRSAEGLLIETMGYHARPLRLTDAELAELGLRILESVDPIAEPRNKPSSTRDSEP